MNTLYFENKTRKGSHISGHFIKINTEVRITIGGDIIMISPIKDIHKISMYASVVLYAIIYNIDKQNVCKLSIDGLKKYIKKIKKKFNIDKSMFHMSNMKRYLDTLVKYKFIYINEEGKIILSPLFGTITNPRELKTINEMVPEDMRYIGIQDTCDEVVSKNPNHPLTVMKCKHLNKKYTHEDESYNGTRQIKEYKNEEGDTINIAVAKYTYRDFTQLNLKKEETEELIAMAIKKEIDLRFFLIASISFFDYDNIVHISKYRLAKRFDCSIRTIDTKVKQLVNAQIFKKEQMDSEKKREKLKKINKKRKKNKKPLLKKICNKVVLFFNAHLAVKTNLKQRISFWGKSLTDKSIVYSSKELSALIKGDLFLMKLVGKEEYCRLKGIEYKPYKIL